jgi:hypothetical protein
MPIKQGRLYLSSSFLYQVMRKYPGFELQSAELSRELLQAVDCVLIATDHSCYDYGFIFGELLACRVVFIRTNY